MNSYPRIRGSIPEESVGTGPDGMPVGGAGAGG
jgi:hypothetical protein